MNNQELVTLIKLCQENDRNAFRKLVESYQYMVYSLAFRLLGNEDDARDVVQETFIRLWLNIQKYNSSQKLSTWLYKIGTNLCLDKIKSNKRKCEVSVGVEQLLQSLVSEDNAEQKLLNTELGTVIQYLADGLSPKQKIVFSLRYLEDLNIDEIRKITGMSAEKIKSNLYAARQIMKNKLKKYR